MLLTVNPCRNPKLKTAEFGTQTEPPPGSRGRGKGIVSDRLNKARKTAHDFDKERVKKDRRRVQRARRDSSEDEEEDRYEGNMPSYPNMYIPYVARFLKISYHLNTGHYHFCYMEGLLSNLE